MKFRGFEKQGIPRLVRKVLKQGRVWTGLMPKIISGEFKCGNADLWCFAVLQKAQIACEEGKCSKRMLNSRLCRN